MKKRLAFLKRFLPLAFLMLAVWLFAVHLIRATPPVTVEPTAGILTEVPPTAVPSPTLTTGPTATSTAVFTFTPTEIADPTDAGTVVTAYAVLPQPSQAAPFRCGFTTRITPGWCPAERPIWRYVYYCYGPFTGDGSVCSWDGGGTCQISWGCVASPDG